MQVKTYSPNLENSDRSVQRKRYIFAGVSFLVSVVVGGFLLVALMSMMQSTDNRQQAASGTTTIRVSPAQISATVGKQITIPIELVIGSGSIAVAEVLPTFDTTFFKAVSLQAGADTTNVRAQQKTASDGKRKTRWITDASKPDASYQGSAIVGALFTTGGSGRKAVHECYLADWDDYLLATSDSAAQPANFCRGTTASWRENYTGVIGYAAAGNSTATPLALQECFNQTDSNHFYVTVEGGCAAAYANETPRPVVTQSWLYGWMAPPTSNAFLSTTLVPATIVNGAFTPLLVAAPLTTPPSGVTGQGKVAMLTLEPLKTGTTNINFDQSKTRAPLFGGAPENSIGTYQSASVTITAAPASPVPSPSPSPSPSPTATPTPVTNRQKIEAISSERIRVRTHFTAKAGFNSTDNTNWPIIEVYANNGTNFDGPYDHGSCATKQPGCGTPNRYVDKQAKTLDLTLATQTLDFEIPVSQLVIFPYANDDNTMVSKLSYAFVNDYWNPGTGADRDVAITKVELFGPNNQLLETFTPASRSYTDDPETGIENRFYFDKGIINSQGVKDTSQDGMVKAFDKVELETIVQNNSRATGAWSMKSEGSFNIVSSSIGKKIITALAPVPSLAPSPSPSPSTSPTPPITPTLPPSGNPSPTTPNLLLSFKQQGVTRAGIAVPAQVLVKYTQQGQQTVTTKEYVQTFTSDNNGVLRAPIIPLTGVPISDTTTATVFVKTLTTLRQNMGTMTLRQATSTLDNTTPLLVGDFDRSAGQANLFNILDITLMYSFYEGLVNPITDENRQLDVNFDNVFNTLDMSFVLYNFRTLSKQGEQL